MPSPDPLTPADLRPGQRVRITRRGPLGYRVAWDGVVSYAGANCVTLVEHGVFSANPGPRITQTIEVIE